MRPGTKRWSDPFTFFSIVRGGLQERFWDNVVFNDRLVVVDVIDEHIKGGQALLETVLNDFPLGCSDDSGDDIERPLPIDIFPFGVDREGYAHAADTDFSILLDGVQIFELCFPQKSNQRRETRSSTTRGREQLIKSLGRTGISGQVHVV